MISSTQYSLNDYGGEISHEIEVDFCCGLSRQKENVITSLWSFGKHNIYKKQQCVLLDIIRWNEML